MDIDKIWWKHIIKTNYFWTQVTDALLGGKSTVLFLPAKMPWYETMVDLIEEKLHEENANNQFEQINCPEEEPGRFLLERYCKKEKQATYRDKMGYAAFLGQSDDIVLNNRYLWIRNLSKQKYQAWVEFIVEYNKNVSRRTPALFILEIRDPKVNKLTKKGIENIAFEQMIDTYDLYTFCALIAAKVNCGHTLKPYLADLSANICKDDIELSAYCVQSGEVFLNNPFQIIHQIIHEHEASDGSAFQFTRSEAEIRKCIWESQLKFLFPMIESYRNHFILKYEKYLKKFLPAENAFGEKIYSLQDVEIGMLSYIVGNEDHFLDSKGRQELKLFKDARNHLAHMDILPLNEVQMILSWKP